MLIAIGCKVLLRVIYRHSPLDIRGVVAPSTQLCVGVLRHPLVRAVLMSEVQHCRPIIGEVFGVGTRRAPALLTNIALHGRIECITADDLMHVARWDAARLDERIKSIDGHR